MNKLLTTLLFASSFCSTFAQTEPVNIWVPWSCENGSQVGPMSIGHRSVAIQFDAPWSQGTRMANYRINGGDPVFWQNIGPGRHIFEIADPNPDESVNASTFKVAMDFVDDGGSSIVSTPINVTAEPAPDLIISSLQINNVGVLSWDVFSENDFGGGFGTLATCSNFPIVIQITGENVFGETIFEQDLPCTAGQPTAQGMSWQYQGPATQIRLNATMQRVDTSTQSSFEPFTVVTTQSEWLSVEGVSTTGITAGSDKVNLKCFPNPFESELLISGTRKGWTITDAVGRIIFQGSGESKINTGGFSPGIYIITLDDGSTSMRVVRS